MRRVSASLKATRSTASASPAGTRARSASSSTADPSRRSSSCKSPIAFSGLSERSEFEQTSSASPSDLCAGERRTGFCSTSTTGTPPSARRRAASDPARPAPMTITRCTADVRTRSRPSPQPVPAWMNEIGQGPHHPASRAGARLLPLLRGCPASGEFRSRAGRSPRGFVPRRAWVEYRGGGGLQPAGAGLTNR